MNPSTPFFEVCDYKVVSECTRAGVSRVQAIVEVRTEAGYVRRSASGVGPVHALDKALRACLSDAYPELASITLSDYRVSVVDGSDGTAAHVRVIIQATDGSAYWDAGCVSDNVIDASFEALTSTAVMGILRQRRSVALQSTP